MKYIFTVLILLVLCPFISKAQNNFKPGYIVNFKGDTVKGYVDYHEWWNNPASFTFKKDLSGPSENVTVNNSREIAVTGQVHFAAFNAPISKARVELPNLPTKLDSSFVTQNVFLKLAYSGEDYSLLSYKDNLKIRYYILDKKANQLNELGYYVFTENTTRVRNVRSYQLQLLAVASNKGLNSSVFTNHIMNADYNDGDLFGIFKTLNNDKNKTAGYKSPIGVRFFVGGGLRSTNFKMGDYSYVARNTTTKSTGAFASGGADLLFNKNTRKVFIRAEFAYSESHFVNDNIRWEENHNPFDPNPVPQTKSLDLKQSTFTFSPQLIYNFYDADDFKFFAGLGFAVNWSSNKFNTSKNNALDIDIDKTWYTMPIKVGVLFNDHLEAHVGYSAIGAVLALRNIYERSFSGGINYLF